MATTNQYQTIRAAATFPANNTWVATTAITMDSESNAIRLYVTTAVASVGSMEFYVTHSPPLNAASFDLSAAGDAPEIWGPLVFTGAASKSIVLEGIGRLPKEVVTVYFRATVGQASATVAIDALPVIAIAPNVDITTGDIEIAAENIEISTEIMDDWDTTLADGLDIHGHDAAVGAGQVFARLDATSVVEIDAITLAANTDNLDGKDGLISASELFARVDADNVKGVGLIDTIFSLKSDTSSVAGTATDVNSGAKSAGSQRVVIATNDINLAAINLATVDIPNVIGTDGAAGPTKVVSIGGTQATGEIQEIQVDAAGQLQVDVITLPGGLTGYAEDTAHGDGDIGILALSVRLDAAASTAGASGEYAGFVTDANGRLYVIPPLGTAIMTASAPVTIATDDTQFGAVGAAADVDGNVHGQLRTIGEALEIIDDWDESDRAKVNPIVGQAGIAADAGAMDALTTRVTIATDDTHFGAVGAAADVDGVVHAQLRTIGTAVEIIDDWDESDRCKSNPIVGQAGIAANAGVMDVLTTRVTIATDDTHYGVVGAAADVDGVVHGQLRTIGEAVELIDDAIHADDGAWTNDVSKHALVGGLYQSVPQTVTDGRVAPIQVDSNGNIIESNSVAIKTAVEIVDNIVGVHDTGAAPTSGAMLLGIARNTQEAAATEDRGARVVTNLNGEIVTAGHTWATNSNRAEEVDPISQQFVNESLVDTTNEAAATHYYPDSDGFSMDGYSDLSFTFKLIDADETLTLTIEATNDEDTSGGDWIQVYGYDDKNNGVLNSWAVTNGTLTGALSFNNANFRHFRAKVIAGGATNTVICKVRRKAL